MKTIKSIALLCMLSLCLTSCMVTRTNVGNYAESTGDVYTYSKSKQLYLFGIFRLGHTNAATPSSKDCQVVTCMNVGDVLISALTCGIVCSQTVRVRAKREMKK